VLNVRGLILLTCGNWGNVFRLLYPLATPDAVFGEGRQILEQAILGV
jgi:4-aminobutyrate aminotransferase